MEQQMPPMPTNPKGYKVSDLKALAKQTNATLKAMLGPAFDAMPPEQREVKVELSGQHTPDFPPNLWVALNAIDTAVKQLAPPDMAQKYDLELANIGEGPSVTAGKLRMIEKDKKLLKALQEPPPEMVPGAPPPPPPEQMAEMDERVMGMM